MPHIHTEPGQIDHTASGFIIYTGDKEPKLVLHVHKKLGILLQFGGHIELDETPWEAVVHEVREESGYEIGQLKLLQPKQRFTQESDSSVLHPVAVAHNTHDFDDKHRHTDSAYVFVTDQKPKHEVEDGESGDLSYLSRKELAELDKGKIYENVRDIGLYIFDVCLKEWDRVDPKEFEA